MRIDLHMHTLMSDGELLPIELARRAFVKGHEAIAFTDHASLSNLERVIGEGRKDAELAGEWGLKVLAGVELTHVPASKISFVAERARQLGAEIIVVHGETIVEPVEPGTNYASACDPNIDILAHPGLIDERTAQAAADNGVHLEITSKMAHCKTNGHVAAMARKVGARMVVNTDTHSPSDLIDDDMALKVALGAGLSPLAAKQALERNPLELIKRLGR
jgi:histidinol phosphatase-like PHP family hydrolase